MLVISQRKLSEAACSKQCFVMYTTSASRLPLGVPGKLLFEVLALAEQLIGTPSSKRAAGRAAERQAGYVVLGALPLSLPPERLVVSHQPLPYKITGL